MGEFFGFMRRCGMVASVSLGAFGAAMGAAAPSAAETIEGLSITGDVVGRGLTAASRSVPSVGASVEALLVARGGVDRGLSLPVTSDAAEDQDALADADILMMSRNSVDRGLSMLVGPDAALEPAPADEELTSQAAVARGLSAPFGATPQPEPAQSAPTMSAPELAEEHGPFDPQAADQDGAGDSVAEGGEQTPDRATSGVERLAPGAVMQALGGALGFQLEEDLTERLIIRRNGVYFDMGEEPTSRRGVTLDRRVIRFGVGARFGL